MALESWHAPLLYSRMAKTFEALLAPLDSMGNLDVLQFASFRLLMTGEAAPFYGIGQPSLIAISPSLQRAFARRLICVLEDKAARKIVLVRLSPFL